MVILQKGVPLPKNHKNKYPWGNMSVGDSFFAVVGKSNNLGSSIKWAKKRYGYQLTYRTVVEDGVRGIRVWRIG